MPARAACGANQDVVTLLHIQRAEAHDAQGIAVRALRHRLSGCRHTVRHHAHLGAPQAIALVEECRRAVADRDDPVDAPGLHALEERLRHGGSRGARSGEDLGVGGVRARQMLGHDGRSMPPTAQDRREARAVVGVVQMQVPDIRGRRCAVVERLPGEPVLRGRLVQALGLLR